MIGQNQPRVPRYGSDGLPGREIALPERSPGAVPGLTRAKLRYFTPRFFLTVAAVTSVYLVAARIGLSLAFATKQVTAFWPPTGIAVAALLLFGYRVWPAVFLGAFVVNATTDEPLFTAAGIAVGNTLGPLFTVFLLREFARFDNHFARARDALGLCLCGAIGMTLTASNGVANLALAGIVAWSEYASVWWVWWVGDTMGVLVVAPLIIAWAARSRMDYDLKKVAELAALLMGLLGLGLIALTGTLLDGSVLSSYNYALLPSIIWAFVIWGALRFSQRETTLIIALIVGLAVWGAIHDRGPFTTGNLDERLILLELYMAAVVLTGLALGTVTAERRRAQAALQEANYLLELRVEKTTQSESELRNETRELAASNAALEEFAYVASHDLQEPLRKVNAFADLLIEEVGDGLNETGKDYIRRMQEAARRMSTMIHDLLQLSRASASSEQYRNVAILDIATSALQDVEASLNEAGAQVVLRAPGVVCVSPAGVRQVFVNLVGNAVKFRRKDTPLRIEIVAGPAANGMVEVAVSDNGIGFDQQYAERIFKPFERLHTREAYEGTGIGLAVCRKIVERHRGRIDCEGKPGEGATFRLRLPAAREGA
jgi:signal transduction histidine kinase